MHLLRLWGVGLVVVLCGCAEILGFDQYSEGEGTTGGGGGSGGATSVSTGAGGMGVGGAGGGAGGAGGAAREPECSEVMPCELPGEPQCETVTCLAGVCVYDPEPAGKLLAVQNPGDCKQVQCDGRGDAIEVDAVDPPDDSNPCLDHACESGVVVPVPVASNVACSAGFCDGRGNCVGCVSAATCPGSDDECKIRTCVNETCGFNYTPNGTPVSSQTSENCQQNQCDGNGNVKSAVDNGDTPSDDGNQCTSETCSGGVPAHPPKPSGATCNQGGNQCNGSGVCKYTTGNTCSASSQCLSGYCVDGRCCSSACAGACKGCAASLTTSPDGTCGNINAGETDGSLCTAGKACSASGVCEVKRCTFFVGSDYGGDDLPVTAGTYHADLGDVAAGFGDKLSSHQCTGGAQAQLWEHDSQNGSTWIFDAADPPMVPTYHPPANYGSLGDNASSLEVF